MKEGGRGSRIPHLKEGNGECITNAIATATSTMRRTQVVSTIVGISTIEIIKIDQISSLIVEISTRDIECETLHCTIIMDATSGNRRSKNGIALGIFEACQRAPIGKALNQQSTLFGGVGGFRIESEMNVQVLFMIERNGGPLNETLGVVDAMRSNNRIRKGSS